MGVGLQERRDRGFGVSLVGRVRQEIRRGETIWSFTVKEGKEGKCLGEE